MTGLFGAASFLTRVPLSIGSTPGGLAGSVPWFPVVGALLGLVAAAVYAVLIVALPSLVAATVSVAAVVAMTGALHEDGLADTADAFGGEFTAEETMRILRDPAHGTFGVVAIVLTALLRVGSLAALDASAALAVLPVAHAVSRSGAVAITAVLPPAASSRLGASYAALATKRQVATGLLVAAVVAVALLGPLGVVPVALAGAISWAIARWSTGRIGGFTGDVLGAAQQLSEAAIMVFGAGLMMNLVPVPWWR